MTRVNNPVTDSPAISACSDWDWYLILFAYNCGCSHLSFSLLHALPWAFNQISLKARVIKAGKITKTSLSQGAVKLVKSPRFLFAEEPSRNFEMTMGKVIETWHLSVLGSNGYN